MAHLSDQTSVSLATLGWSAFFEDQVEPDEATLAPMRIATVHRSRLTAESEGGPTRLSLPAHAATTDFAVGDWTLVDRETQMVVRLLDRRALLAGKGRSQREQPEARR